MTGNKKVKEGVEVKVVGISEHFSFCKHCKRETHTIVKIVNGRKICSCMHCEGTKKDPKTIKRL